MIYWREATGLIDVVNDLAVGPSLGPQRQHTGNQRLLVVAQRSNVEGGRTAADDESLGGFSGETLRSRSQ